MNFFEISFLLFAFLGLLLSVFFFVKRKGDRIANAILGIYLILFAYNITWNSLYWSELIFTERYASLLFTNHFPWISYGPLFYLYVRRVIKQRAFKRYDIFHFLPLILVLIGKWPLLILDSTSKLTVLTNGTWRDYGYTPKFIAWIIILQLFIYGVSTLVILRKNKPHLGSNKKMWLKFFISFYFGYWIAFTSYFVLAALALITKENDYFIGYMIVFFIGMVSYFGLMQPDVFNGLSMEKIIPFIKYKKTGLTKSHSIELKERLIIIMANDKPFLENDLRLEDLAKLLNLSRHHMSQVINEHFQLPFFDYINQHRITEAKGLLMDKRGDLNITQIAYSVGFNNRVSFYKAFKKFTGTTPSDYINNIHSRHDAS
ncbi:helix-turn-helix domain-containing protein [Flavobacteriaceae bacterium R38]|nr:helix-turn-helix domain-containing protein [Flavobacteriaceae bacterium R38]